MGREGRGRHVEGGVREARALCGGDRQDEAPAGGHHVLHAHRAVVVHLRGSEVVSSAAIIARLGKAAAFCCIPEVCALSPNMSAGDMVHDTQ